MYEEFTLDGKADEDITPEDIVKGLTRLIEKTSAQQEGPPQVPVMVDATDVRAVGLAERVIRRMFVGEAFHVRQ